MHHPSSHSLDDRASSFHVKNEQLWYCTMAEGQIEADSLLEIFDRKCMLYGDLDAVTLVDVDGGQTSYSLCFLELQELSRILASQLHYRYRPSYVLIDCFHHTVPECVALLACLRLRIPFVPVSVTDPHADPGRLTNLVKALEGPTQNSVVAICCVDNDRDPRLGVFYAAGVHRILYMDTLGNLQEQLHVPSSFLRNPRLSNSTKEEKEDHLYVLFTSGTTSSKPKAVIGSQQSTLRRLQWFWGLGYEGSAMTVARRTRLTFVDGITELLSSLLAPADSLLLVALREPEVTDVVALLEALRPHQITLLPSQLSLILRSASSQSLSTLQRLLVSGEVFPPALWKSCKSRIKDFSCQVMNLYGQTESTGDVLAANLNDLDRIDAAIVNDTVAVGKPISSTILITQTSDDELVVQGNLSNGYLTTIESEQNTKLATNSDTFTHFATGDIGFCKNDVWYIRGRCADAQKINGVLTSPLEVEAAFTSLYDVQGPVVCSFHDSAAHLLVEQHVPLFSRLHMREVGHLPWNLIPTKVWLYPTGIPRKVEGAGKIDRKKVEHIIQTKMRMQRDSYNVEQREQAIDASSTLSRADSVEVFKECVRDVLGRGCLIAMNQSFVEHGGDSVTSIQLMYKLRIESFDFPREFSPLFILSSASLQDVLDFLHGKNHQKRQRRVEDSDWHKTFQPSETQQVEEDYWIVPFLACVDASPKINPSQTLIYQVCQGGIVQAIRIDDWKVTAHRQMPGWKFQADPIVLENAIVVCAHSENDDRGCIWKLSLDLASIAWSIELPGKIRSSPVPSHDGTSSGLLYVQASNSIFTIDLLQGNRVGSIECSHDKYGKPGFGTGPQNDSFYLCYGGFSLSWMEKNAGGNLTILKEVECDGEICGPTYKDMVGIRNGIFLVGDSYGCLHLVDTVEHKRSVISSAYISSVPLSSPVYDVDSQLVFIGSYNGMMYCRKVVANRHLLSEENIWEHDIGSSIYATPSLFRYPDNPSSLYILVTTTAGEIVSIRAEDGVELWRTRIKAEIWSNPLIFVKGMDVYAAFGARDSHLHIIKLKRCTRSGS